MARSRSRPTWTSPKPTGWPELHFHEVAAAYAKGHKVMALTKQFEVSQPLISTALRLAREHAARVKEADEGEG